MLKESVRIQACDTKCENKPSESNGHTTQLRGMARWLIFTFCEMQTAGSMIFCETLTPGYAMLMSPNKDETAVHGCHCPGDMAVLMRKVLAIPRSCVV